MSKNYKMKITYFDKTLYEVEVKACNLDQAREFAYEMFEMNTQAEEIED